MKLILLTNLKGKGVKDDIIEASDGYARNYLIPKKIAIPADKKALADRENREASRLRKIEIEKKEAETTAEKLTGIVVKIRMGAGADGKLYGSVTSGAVADALQNDFGISVDRRKIVIPEPIKAHGSYLLDVKLYPDVNGRINLIVCGK